MQQYGQIEMDQKLRSYSSVFSRTVFSDLIKYNCIDKFQEVFLSYDAKAIKTKTIEAYLAHIYRSLSKHYRCEYIYKNEIINSLLLKKFGTAKTIAFNEFKVGNSIADMVMFNGESKAFEIKTEFDTKKRLFGQICDYTRLFQKCYVVVPEEKVQSFEDCVGPNIGIIALKYLKRHIELHEYREAVANQSIDAELVMRSLRTEEYKHLVSTYFDRLPDVSSFDMFDVCMELIKKIPDRDLQILYLKEIEGRKTCTQYLKDIPSAARQMCLSMNLNKKNAFILTEKLKQSLI
jgi:hypothetical protein